MSPPAYTTSLQCSHAYLNMSASSAAISDMVVTRCPRLLAARPALPLRLRLSAMSVLPLIGDTLNVVATLSALSSAVL